MKYVEKQFDELTIAITPLGFNMAFKDNKNSSVKRSIGSAPPVNTSWMM